MLIKAGVLFLATATTLAWEPRGAAQAATQSLSFNTLINSSDYQTLATPFASATQFVWWAPATALDLLGFDISAGATIFDISSSAQQLLNTLTSYTSWPSSLPIGRASFQKGLPFDIDVQFQLMGIPGLISAWGLGVQYALVSGPSPIPAVAIRGMWSSTFQDPSLLQVTHAQIEGVFSISIPPILDILEPYIGLGDDVLSASTNATITNTFGIEESFSQSFSTNELYALVGLRVSLLPLLGIGLDVHWSEAETLYSGRLSLKF